MVDSGKAFVDRVEREIAAGHRNADCIEWVWRDSPSNLFDEEPVEEPDPAASICKAVLDFSDAGWNWVGPRNQLEKDGWYIWFRSQGQLSPPIAQWSRIDESKVKQAKG